MPWKGKVLVEPFLGGFIKGAGSLGDARNEAKVRMLR